MNKIGPKGIQDIGNLVRKKSLQIISAAKFRDSKSRQKSTNFVNLNTNKGKSLESHKSERGTKFLSPNQKLQIQNQQEYFTKKLNTPLFAKNQPPFLNTVNRDADEFESKDLFDFNNILDPVEVNDISPNSEIHDINYAEDKKYHYDKFNENRCLNRNIASTRMNVKPALHQNLKILAHLKDIKGTQTRPASTFEQRSSASKTEPEFFKLFSTHPPLTASQLSPQEEHFGYWRNYDYSVGRQREKPLPDINSNLTFLKENENKSTQRFYAMQKKGRNIFKGINLENKKTIRSFSTSQTVYKKKSKDCCKKERSNKNICKTGGKLCPDMKEASSCADQLNQNPCSKTPNCPKQEKSDCPQKPTRQDCETD